MYPYNITSNYNNKNVNINSAERETKLEAMSFTDKRLLKLVGLMAEETMTLSNFYKDLYKNISDNNDRETIKDIYLDMVKSRKYLEDIYFRSSGEKVSYNNDVNKEITGNKSSDFEKGLIYLSEYSRGIRSLYSLFKDTEIKDYIMEILSDVLGNMCLINFIYIKNK